jgi:formylglycine-generating enzyme required for sulfatase activity
MLFFSPKRFDKQLSAAEECALKPGNIFKECEKCPRMVVVPAGRFKMGSEKTTEESPRHHVKISRPFAVGQDPITESEWLLRNDGSCSRGCDLPHVEVSWIDAVDYTQWLNKPETIPPLPVADSLHDPREARYRLLTEAEREWVTRGGTTTDYWTGDAITSKDANFGQPRMLLLSVQKTKENLFHVRGVHGNVYDWVDDCWHGNYDGAPRDVSSWTNSDCDKHVIRGGSWDSDGSALRSAARTFKSEEYRAKWLGFRIARSLGEPSRTPARMAVVMLIAAEFFAFAFFRRAAPVSTDKTLED